MRRDMKKETPGAEDAVLDTGGSSHRKIVTVSRPEWRGC